MGVDSDTEIAAAEEALKKAEAEKGPNDVSVSYRLDALVRLLRGKNIRLAEAAQMEARARKIRVGVNTTEMSKLTPLSRDISEAIRAAAKRKEEEKNKQTLITIGSVLVVLAIGVRLICFPSPGERVMTQSALIGINKVLPSTMVMDMINKGQSMIDDTKEATAKHNAEVNKYLGDDAANGDTSSGTSDSSSTDAGGDSNSDSK